MPASLKMVRSGFAGAGHQLASVQCVAGQVVSIKLEENDPPILLSFQVERIGGGGGVWAVARRVPVARDSMPPPGLDPATS